METSSPEALENLFSQWLNCPLHLVRTEQEASPDCLTTAEQARLDEFKNEVRRTSWLKGRAAMKQLLSKLGEDRDTSRIQFPHPRYSLTHSGVFAVAVGIVAAQSGAGIGVDFERWRTMNPKAIRFFLTEPEKNWLSQQTEASRQREMLRLWTVKEALYKADLKNLETSYHHYQVADAAVSVGQASGNGADFRYAWVALPEGFLTVAIREGAI